MPRNKQMKKQSLTISPVKTDSNHDYDDVCVICDELCSNSVCLKCYKCARWFHGSCLDSNMPVAMIDYLSKISGGKECADYPIHVFCITCGSKSFVADSTIIESRLSKLEEAINKLSFGSVVFPANNGSSEPVISKESSVTNRSSSPALLIAEEVKKALQQQQQDEVRYRSIIISGLPEDNTRDDTEELISMVNSTTRSLLHTADFDLVARVGKPKQGDSRSRPIRVVFASRVKHIRGDFLRKQKGIRDTDDPRYKSVYINADKTRDELLADYKLREELRRLKASGDDSYIIRRGSLVKRRAVVSQNGASSSANNQTGISKPSVNH